MDDQNFNQAPEENREEASHPEQKSPEAKPKFIKVLIWIIVALLVVWLVMIITTKKNAPIDEAPIEQNGTEVVDGGEVVQEEPVVAPEE